MIVASEIGMAKRVTQCKPIKAAFNAGDVDGDGVMTFDEFVRNKCRTCIDNEIAINNVNACWLFRRLP